MTAGLRDISKDKFNLLTPIGAAGRGEDGYLLWKFKCDCGNECVKRRACVVSGNTKSCGCIAHKTRSGHGGWKGYEEISATHWSHIKFNAKQGDIEFAISIQEAWELYLRQNRKCALSGLDIQFAETTGGKGWTHTTTASLDRIDSGKGYIHGNVQWLHKEVNFMKHRLSVERLLFLCKAITENRNV